MSNYARKKEGRSKMHVHIRWMLRRDIPEVLSIENQSYQCPCTESELVEMIKQRRCVVFVAEVDDQVAGYMLYEFERHTLTLLKLGVRRDARRTGVGSKLINKLKEKLSVCRKERIVLEVSDRNLPAHLFFSHLGFRANAVITDSFGNASYAMEYSVSDAIPRKEPIQ